MVQRLMVSPQLPNHGNPLTNPLSHQLSIHQTVLLCLAQAIRLILLRRVARGLVASGCPSNAIGVAKDGASAVLRVQNAVAAFAYKGGPKGRILLVGDVGSFIQMGQRFPLPHISTQFDMATLGDILSATETIHNQLHMIG